jgi:hypothetical protein
MIEFKRGDYVTDGLIEGHVITPLTFYDHEPRTVICMNRTKANIDLDPTTLTKLESSDNDIW